MVVVLLMDVAVNIKINYCEKIRFKKNS